MKITKRQLRRIIKEEKAKIQEIGGYNLGDDEAFEETYYEFVDKFTAIVKEMLQLGMLPEDIEDAFNVARGNNNI
ncbi:MAG: hypothetical protein CMB52_05320 [Euryarchaeota archaeon]|nr:hypothetical protein [Euryarchaeota archaeon]|tara:strand:+ start:1526 stop:1750 length:225 start_codon:yes stop_codon:yes gene_type:complete